MVLKSNFVVRKSAYNGAYYIDYNGHYTLQDISNEIHQPVKKLQEVYEKFDGTFSSEMNVFYFPSLELAKHAVEEALSGVDAADRGKAIYLTESEIEYIRKALINEDSNIISLKTKIKDTIFKKLNE